MVGDLHRQTCFEIIGTVTVTETKNVVYMYYSLTKIVNENIANLRKLVDRAVDSVDDGKQWNNLTE